MDDSVNSRTNGSQTDDHGVIAASRLYRFTIQHKCMCS